MGTKRPARKENLRHERGAYPADVSPASIVSPAGQEDPRRRPEARDDRRDGSGRLGFARTRLLGLLLFLLVTAVFLPALRHDFIYYDDPGFVTENPHVRDGLTWANVKWAFLSEGIDYWRPLSWLSHMADCQIFGLNPWGHHLTSVLLHAFNTLLVFAVLRKMTGAMWRSLLVAALFGLHPLHVESVAWVAERKDVLSTLFGLLTLWAYAHWVQQRAAQRPRTWRFYGLALAAFALGLMSKPMVVTVPCVLLLLDFWPLNRLGGARRRPTAAAVSFLVVEKVPFFVLAAAIGAFTFFAQKQVGALKTVVSYPWPDRIANALIAYGRYLGKCVFPARLAVFYPYSLDQPMGRTVLAGVLLAGITTAACILARRRPYLLVGWLWFLGTLVPVIGLVQVGGQSMADRYSYMPLVGVFIVVAWFAGDVAARWPRQSRLLGATAGALVAGCSILTSRQLAFWQDSTTLFRHALAVTDNNWAAHTYLGFALAKSPAHVSEAIAEYQAALRIAPDLAVAHNYLANALTKSPGRLPEAIAEFQAALRLDPTLADAHHNLATALAMTPGRLSEAIPEYRAALRLRPDSAEMHYNLGLALTRMAALPEAVTEYQKAVQLKSDYAEAHCALGRALAPMPGRLADAITEFQTVLRLWPDSAEAHYLLGNALAATPGRSREAIAEYEAAIRIQPDDAQAQFSLGLLLSTIPGRLSEVIAAYSAAVRAQPGFAAAHYNLGSALAELPGRLPEAIAEYEAALRAQPDFAEAHNNLADALARTPGRSSAAIAEYEAAIRIRPDYFQAHFNLGLLLTNIPGRRAEAIAHFNAALQIKPDFVPARTMLDRLRAPQ